MLFAFNLVFKNTVIIRTITRTSYTHYRQNSLTKIFKKLLTTNCKNNAAFSIWHFHFRIVKKKKTKTPIYTQNLDEG